ncbi:hypothetical protein EVAR_5353_1 [Eumeta japonica]|uniref:Uncharacterized protein n=1 Tax=Eumeta variegata TaxID=151549 RepID=A0A4C1TNR0_EUMVA|nr:hypothetical protein EVAR_5353_1 [Eumeta japonica]
MNVMCQHRVADRQTRAVRRLHLIALHIYSHRFIAKMMKHLVGSAFSRLQQNKSHGFLYNSLYSIFKGQTSMRAARKYMATSAHEQQLPLRSHQRLAGVSRTYALFLKTPLSWFTGNIANDKSF